MVDAVRLDGPVTRSGAPGAPDLGRLAFVPLAVLLLLANLLAAWRSLHGETGLGQLPSRLMTACFYGLVVALYLRRGGAVATTASWPAKLAAVAGCWLPLLLPLAGGAPSGPRLSALGDVLVLSGVGGAVWSLRTLGRSFSVLPQARALIVAGPYRLVRHPLYLAELLAGVGLVLAAPSAAKVGVWCLVLALQLYRCVHEERVLLVCFPEYADYAARTRRLVPGLV